MHLVYWWDASFLKQSDLKRVDAATEAPAPPSRRLRFTFAAAGAAITAIIVAYMALALWKSYRDAIADAERNTQNFLRVVEAQVSGVVNIVDLTLSSIDQSLRLMPRPGPKVDELLRQRLELAPYARVLFIADADGRVIHDSGNFTAMRLNVGQRDYFLKQREGLVTGNYIGAPVLSMATRTWMIPVSRRLDTAAGRFAGVLVAVVDPRHFQEFFSSIDTGEQGSVSLYLRDGMLLARGPQIDNMIGRSLADAPVFRDLLPRAESGTAFARSGVDQVTRIFSYRTLAGGRLVALVGVGESEVVAGWRRHAGTQFIVLLVFVGTVAWFTVLLARQIVRQHVLTRQLLDSEARLAGIVSSAMDGIVTVDDAQRIVQFNPAAEHMFGQAAAEVKGQALDVLIPERFQATHRHHVQAFGANGATTRRKGALGTIVGRRASGEEFPIEASISHLEARGRKFYTVILRDITERKRAEDELHRYLGQLKVLHDVDKAILAAHSPGAIASISLQHLRRILPYWGATVRVIDYESNAAILLAYERDPTAEFNPRSRRTLDEYDPADLAEMKQGRACAVQDIAAMSARPVSIERLFGKGMRSSASVPLMVEGALVGVLNIASNETGYFTADRVEIARAVADHLAIALQQALLRERVERQSEELERRVAERTAQLEEANKELEAFSYSVSHDLRAPLRHIDGFAKLLVGEVGNANETVARYLDIISRSAARMGALIDDLLEFSRMSRAPLHAARVDLNALVEEVREECLRDAPGRNIEWKLGALPGVAADARLLRLALVNLVANAIKFTSRRKHASIEIDARAGEGDEVVVRIADNGAGFDMRFADKLFGVFQRLHREDEFEGTGIGLATVRRILHRHGGRIWVESEPDRGTSFYITLKRAGEDTREDQGNPAGR